MTDSEKSNFYDKITIRDTKVRDRRRNRDKESKRCFSYKYYLPILSQKVRVCKKLYLYILCISQRRVSYFHENKRTGITGTPESDCRDTKTTIRINEDRRDRIRKHINSFPRVPAHYCRKDSVKEYFEAGLNLRKMYEQI